MFEVDMYEIILIPGRKFNFGRACSFKLNWVQRIKPFSNFIYKLSSNLRIYFWFV
jgi:hypothetical protein